MFGSEFFKVILQTHHVDVNGWTEVPHMFKMVREFRIKKCQNYPQMFPNVCYCPVGMQTVMACPLLLVVEYSQSEVCPSSLICNDKIIKSKTV